MKFEFVGLDFDVRVDDLLVVRTSTHPFKASDIDKVKAEYHALIDEAFANFEAHQEQLMCKGSEDVGIWKPHP